MRFEVKLAMIFCQAVARGYSYSKKTYTDKYNELMDEANDLLDPEARNLAADMLWNMFSRAPIQKVMLCANDEIAMHDLLVKYMKN